MLERVLLVCAVCVLTTFDDALTNSDVLGTVERIKADGYPAETHRVTTIDGYILAMHRIPHGRGETSSSVYRPVVFLMHGLMGASSSFIGLGANYSLAYNLADAGFDVWMGNARGNKDSRFHINLDPDDNMEKYTFFDFTFEEIGFYDLPTMIDYVLEATEQLQLHYIGHSQGGTVFLVLGALRPDYNEKIASAHLLAGVGYQNYFPDEELATSAVNVDFIYSMALMMGIVELYPEFLDNLTPRADGYEIADYCTGNLGHKHMCELFGIKRVLGEDRSSEVDSIAPAGASLKQAAHYGQNIRDKLFRRYHFGTETNMLVYGLEEPPKYDLSRITIDVTMHYTVNDKLLDERDVLAMAADMPNTKVRKVARETFLHEDFVAAPDAKALVTDYIIEAMKNTPIADESDIEDITPDPGIGSDTTTVTPVDQTVTAVDQTITTVGQTVTTVDQTVAPVNQTVTPDVIDVTAEAVVVTTPIPDSAASSVLNSYLILFSLYFIFK